MSFYQTDTGYAGFTDQSRFTRDLAEKILKKISKESFNPGQQTIAENTKFDAWVLVDWTVDYDGGLSMFESQVTKYDFKINCPHPEAVSETLQYIEDQVKDIVYEIFENSYVSEIGDTIDVIREIEHDNLWFVFNKVGVLI